MKEEISQGQWRKLLLPLVALVGILLLMWVFRPRERQPETAAPSQRETATTTQEALRAKLEKGRLEQRPTAEDRTRAAIDSHQAAIDADPNSPDTPALLNAMGNLYRQKLRDYQSAAEAYQRIIIDYPTWDGAYGVYPQLEVCYEQLLDHEGLIWLYETMMKRFPAEAQEYKYAQQQLGLPETPTPPAPAEEAAPEAGAATAEGEPSPPETETPPAALAPS